MQKNPNTLALITGIATFMMWGLFPIYFKLLENVPAIEVLAHRVVWSLLFLFMIIAYRKRIKNIIRYTGNKKLMRALFLTGVLIASNWGIYIYAVSTDRILYASLGYLINPLFSILLGAIFLKEKLSRPTKISICLVVAAIANEMYALGEIPFISLLLPGTFAIYGLLKKQIQIAAIDGLFFETMLIFPLAIIYLSFLGISGNGAFSFSKTGFLLAFSGIVTVLPLITFNFAAVHLKLQTIGFLQYISPIIAVLLAVFVYGEHLEMHKIISFAIILAGLAIVSLSGILRRKDD
ncbi:EamA family transporter RarD [Campylobacter hominis]|uniref:RarD protein n=1 Tax=Campylobacter hominis (strain ATCC BAA-381 / DSM 21671 / CCUG 45161 / LMG 19568 / NCTC 13146 / CH001A) TaxID=360107 RepID=A7I1M4_CAMHC|nr:EamA family transporter RarD [Campylobacter hominis]ABS51199.1 RarD protein [Campylobacter hominis ATCC BAA-381]UAK86290.1 EamA family transporter RarD [Campylobacter hominis]SUW84955.1 RarD protein [Campylobacter hominis]